MPSHAHSAGDICTISVTFDCSDIISARLKYYFYFNMEPPPFKMRPHWRKVELDAANDKKVVHCGIDYSTLLIFGGLAYLVATLVRLTKLLYAGPG